MTVTRILVRTTYLKLATDAPLRPPDRPRPDYELRQAVAPTPEFARFLYVAVGYPWNWTRRLPWSYTEWECYLADSNGEIWVAYMEDTVAGYFEVVASDDGMEIRQFGMLPRFTGRGIGGYLLCDAVQRTRVLHPRVWLHTCTADHPHALANYQARGFRTFKEEQEYEEVTTEAEPWPGAFAS